LNVTPPRDIKLFLIAVEMFRPQSSLRSPVSYILAIDCIISANRTKTTISIGYVSKLNANIVL